MFPWVRTKHQHYGRVTIDNLQFSGTFAIVCLMTGKVVSEHANLEVMANGTKRFIETEALLSGNMTLTNVQVATTVTFGVALLQVRFFSSLVIFLLFVWYLIVASDVHVEIRCSVEFTIG